VRKIDFHCHAFLAEFFEAMEQIYTGAIELKRDTRGRRFALWANRPLPVWDSDARLKEIDSAGIDIEILSNPPLYSRVDERAPELCRLVNDVLAVSCSRAADRFKALARLPFNDTGAALNELSRALDQLGCVGVLVTSNIGGRYLDAPEFEPFWAEVNRRGTPVFMHPAISPCYRDHQPATVLSFPFDTTLSAHNWSVRICSRVSPRSRSCWLISAGHCLIWLNGLISRSIRPDFMDPIQNQRGVRAKGCAGFIVILHLIGVGERSSAHAN
jgi:predicted TIM-barrel fold metal-dependent hydrolase